MAKVKSYKSSDQVLTFKDKLGRSVIVTPQNFDLYMYEGTEVSGEDYYVDKAVGRGAKKKGK